jgi:hypothetical protein
LWPLGRKLPDGYSVPITLRSVLRSAAGVAADRCTGAVLQWRTCLFGPREPIGVGVVEQ